MLAGGSGATGLAKKRVCRRATRRAEGAARSDRSRESVVGAATMRLAAHLLHRGASPATFSLSLCVCVCAPVCVSIACGAPACLSGCDFQVQYAASSWWDYDRRSRYHKVVHLAMHGTSAK